MQFLFSIVLVVQLITLKYNATTKPVLADRNGETVGNWVGIGNHAVVASSDHAHSGIKSLKLTATDVGNVTNNHIYLPSANNATFVIGTQYAVTFWVWGSPVSQNLNIKTGGVTGNLGSVNVAAWTGYTFLFTATSVTTNLQLWITGDVDTVYLDDFTITEAVQVNGILVRGFDEPDDFDLFPAIQKHYLDGSVEDQNKVFRRLISFDAGTINTSADRKKLLYWTLDNDRQIDWKTEFQIPVSLPEGTFRFSFDWLNGFVGGRKFKIDLIQETITRTEFPV